VLNVRTMNKALASVFVFIVLSSLMVLTVKPVCAQAVSTPSVPQIVSVKLVNYSYDVPPSTITTTDPYTGKETTTTNPGYHVENIRIEVTIKKQSFTPYTANGYTYNLYYTVQVKGHFGDNWTVFSEQKAQLDSDTICTGFANYATGDQLDFRVRAIVVGEEGGFLYPVTDTTSDWSKVQTFTMPDDPSTVPPSQTATQPTNPPTTSNNNQPQLPNQTQSPSNIFNPFFLLWIGTLIRPVRKLVASLFVC